MTQFELAVVLRKLSNIKKYLGQLKTIAQSAQADNGGDFIQQLAIERLLHLLVESAIDINMHLAVRNDHLPPDTYRDSFITAGRIGAIAVNLAQQLAPSAGLRNRLVHDYDEVDPEIVRRSIAFALELFPQYLQQVQDYLRQIEAE
ncbi:DUF86 domain-containing protein [Leptolyngbya sp. BC1307]|uniref:type VII toxin-antitoxin system HepT family RNase toxin n=1 Tax=Leptolyngbya sp. BC1307 TaxID=2029589 RepID=UPI000EFB63B8|nr:DUF86 domain-containing protein [Leptolyngbya sp. BC1307]